MHLLLMLMPCFRPTSPEQVNTIICAQWPDPDLQPTLFNIVKRCMVHGPCGMANPCAPCMKNGVCSKGFPKPFQEWTVLTTDGYPIYAQPANQQVYDVWGFHADNQWIVPYNPSLLARFVPLLHTFPLPMSIFAHFSSYGFIRLSGRIAHEGVTKYLTIMQISLFHYWSCATAMLLYIILHLYFFIPVFDFMYHFALQSCVPMSQVMERLWARLTKHGPQPCAVSGPWAPTMWSMGQH